MVLSNDDKVHSRINWSLAQMISSCLYKFSISVRTLFLPTYFGQRNNYCVLALGIYTCITVKIPYHICQYRSPGPLQCGRRCCYGNGGKSPACDRHWAWRCGRLRWTGHPQVQCELVQWSVCTLSGSRHKQGGEGREEIAALLCQSVPRGGQKGVNL